MKNQKYNHPKGFSVAEVILAMAVATGVVYFGGRSLTLHIAQRNTFASRMEAYHFAEEAVKIAESFGIAPFSAVCPNGPCVKYLAESGGNYSLTDTPESLEAIFTRTLRINPIGIDTGETVIKANPNGTVTGYEVTAEVAWADSTGEHQVDIPWTVFNP